MRAFLMLEMPAEKSAVRAAITLRRDAHDSCEIAFVVTGKNSVFRVHECRSTRTAIESRRKGAINRPRATDQNRPRRAFAKPQVFDLIGSPTRARTWDLRINRAPLAMPLSRKVSTV